MTFHRGIARHVPPPVIARVSRSPEHSEGASDEAISKNYVIIPSKQVENILALCAYCRNRKEVKMASVFDVAQYILQKQGKMTAMKLQKLVYYCQAWSLVWDEEPLFNETIEAWASGPVVRELYNVHKGMFAVTSSSLQKSNPDNLTPAQKETVDVVLDFYGDKSAQWLSDLTHIEEPWRSARKGFEEGENCDNEITIASICEYYSEIESSN